MPMPTDSQPDSRLDRLEAAIAADAACGGSDVAAGGGRVALLDSDRVTALELIRLARTAKATLKPKRDLTDEAQVRKLAEDVMELMQLLADITPDEDDDEFIGIAANVVGQRRFAPFVANGVGLYHDLREAHG